MYCNSQKYIVLNLFFNDKVILSPGFSNWKLVLTLLSKILNTSLFIIVLKILQNVIKRFKPKIKGFDETYWRFADEK